MASIAVTQQVSFKFTVNAKINDTQDGTHLSSFCEICRATCIDMEQTSGCAAPAIANIGASQQESFRFTVNAKINGTQVGTHLSSFCSIYFSIYGKLETPLLLDGTDNGQHCHQSAGEFQVYQVNLKLPCCWTALAMASIYVSQQESFKFR